jgi:hypothetical protein
VTLRNAKGESAIDHVIDYGSNKLNRRQINIIGIFRKHCRKLGIADGERIQVTSGKNALYE